MLRKRLPRYDLSLLGYCLTSNHVHLLFRAASREAIAGLMQSLAGDFSSSYNRRKRRSNAFWGERYHTTLVEGAQHLWRCLRYIDLNMVRVGIVSHPREWAWCGYQEIAGSRRRYCLVDTEQLLDGLGENLSLATFRDAYEADIADRIQRDELARDARWTESLAVGSKSFVERTQATI